MSDRRQITEAEKARLLEQHGRRCFVDGEPIPEDDAIEFHHIRPFSDDGPTSLDNMAPVCKRHHRGIGTMSLQEYRDKLDLGQLFQGEPKYLDDVIRAKTGTCGMEFRYELADAAIRLYFENTSPQYPLDTCPTTGWRYFYATVPVKHLRNDKELQPRALREGSMWGLYRHFQSNTQLAPSICRIDEKGDLLLFDGQHKAAAQIWAGHPLIECKVYVCPDDRRLKETNLEAHGNLRQMPFYSHELMRKYAAIFGEDWQEYMETEGEKSEQGFFSFLVHAKAKTRAQARNGFALAMYNEIVDDPTNKLSAYLSEKPRGPKQPLAFARLRKTFFQQMLLPPPVEDEFESDGDLRKEEKKNLVKLMNIVAEEGLEGRWDPDRADAAHRKAERIFSAGAVRAWVVLLRDTINAHLRHYTDDQRRRFFYRRIADEDFEYFRLFVHKIFSHKIWDDPDPSGEIAARLAKDDATTARSLFEEKGLTVQWVMGA